MASVHGLVHRDQTSKSVPKSTVNTVIAVTIILGVIFIAFALFVIYWMYMRSIDRHERRVRERRKYRAQLEMSRKLDSSPSGTLQKDRRSKDGALVDKDRQRSRGSGWSHGKLQICDNIIFAHQYYGSGWPQDYSKMESSYQEPKFSSRRNTRWIDEVDLEGDLRGHSHSDRRALRFNTSRPQFSIPTHNGAPMFPSSPLMTDSESPDTQSISSLQASYQPLDRNGSVRMGHGGFNPDLDQGRTGRKASFSPSYVDRGDYAHSHNGMFS